MAFERLAGVEEVCAATIVGPPRYWRSTRQQPPAVGIDQPSGSATFPKVETSFPGRPLRGTGLPRRIGRYGASCRARAGIVGGGEVDPVRRRRGRMARAPFQRAWNVSGAQYDIGGGRLVFEVAGGHQQPRRWHLEQFGGQDGVERQSAGGGKVDE
ncbi:hypothetical protein ACIF85_42245 [Streptomyces sp. NPDC086033]|uniref:hypothetical protein n=1 Tax=Streptomyces sp. NPDC086033 TaxID=3365747 RepID=UPI0037D95AC6